MQNDNLLVTFCLLFLKWPVFLPFITCFSFWIFRNRQAHLINVQKFFADFRVGGHRGSPTRQPENTIASMEQAKIEGADLIEFDVSLTKDGVAVILHDDTLDRTTNMCGQIRSVYYADLKECNCAAKFDSNNNAEAKGQQVFMKLPTLDELVRWAKTNQMKMLFDVKDSDLCLLTKMAELFSTYQLYDMGIISSFFPTVAYRIKHHDPRILTGLTWRRWFWSYTDLQCQIRRNSISIVHMIALVCDILYVWSIKSWLPAFLGVDMMLTERLEISENYVRQQERAGRKVCAWTVNDENEMMWMRKTLNIPILTDKPFLAMPIEQKK